MKLKLTNQHFKYSILKSELLSNSDNKLNLSNSDTKITNNSPKNELMNRPKLPSSKKQEPKKVEQVEEVIKEYKEEDLEILI
jgi:hypothetical protein